MTKQLAQKPEDPEAGAFIGFDSSNESDLSQDEVYENTLRMFLIFNNCHINFAYILQGGNNILYQDNLLDGLPMWLDRLFEGLTHRYYINYWPEFTAK